MLRRRPLLRQITVERKINASAGERPAEVIHTLNGQKFLGLSFNHDNPFGVAWGDSDADAEKDAVYLRCASGSDAGSSGEVSEVWNGIGASKDRGDSPNRPRRTSQPLGRFRSIAAT